MNKGKERKLGSLIVAKSVKEQLKQPIPDTSDIPSDNPQTKK
jgi:hypothetical protein